MNEYNWKQSGVTCPECLKRLRDLPHNEHGFPIADEVYDVGNIGKSSMGHQHYHTETGTIALCSAKAKAHEPTPAEYSNLAEHEMAHTPGPWTMQRGDPYDCRFEVNSEGPKWGAVANVSDNCNGSRIITEEEAEANARLIAACPDLLEACEYTLKIIGDVEEAEDNEEWVRAIHAKLRPAIAKAKGTT